MTPRTGPARIRPHLIVCLAALALLLHASAAGAAATWTRVSSPNRGTVASALQDVAMVPGTATAWAVGYYYDSNVAAYRTMTQRYNGGWSIVPSVNGSATGYSQLNRVDASAANNAWAIGYDTSQPGSLVERYDGVRWGLVAAPAGVALRGLDVVSPTEVWAAGYAGSAATVTQWKNGTWTTRYTQPVASRHLTVFEAVAVDATGQVWAVGWDRDYNAAGRPVSSLVVHFDGTTWTREATPNPANRNTLNDVVALANGEVFAVGVAQDTSGGGITPRSLMLRRQGTTWSSLTVPQGEAGSTDQLLSVAAVSSGSVWAVGYYNSPSSGLYEPLLVHWTANGAAGTLTTSHTSPPLTMSGLVSGVSANPAGDLWAAGYASPPGVGDTTLVLRGSGG
jgi:hypothetical protein